jgi:excisionase family DNA binding protein
MNRTGESVATSETPYMTRAEAAAYLRTTTRTLDTKIKAQKIKAYRFGRAVLLLKEDLDEFVRNS